MSIDAASSQADEQQSLSTAAARNLATTTKTVPQTQNITSRWLLRMLPWVQVAGGTYRVNRRLSYEVGGGGQVSFAQTAGETAVIPPSLRQVPLLAGLSDDAALSALGGRFAQREVEAGSVIATAGQPQDEFILIAHGRVSRSGTGHYGNDTHLGVLADGDYLGADGLADEEATTWDYTATAATATTLLVLPRQSFRELADSTPALQDQVREFRDRSAASQNKYGEAAIEIAAGHGGEPSLPVTFADYELAPREYDLSVAQTVLRVHSRVADLYNQPMNQVEQQLRLTIEELRERQEHELINNPEFGLLHNVDYRQRVHTSFRAADPRRSR